MFKCLKTSSQQQTFLYYWHVEQIFSNSSLVFLFKECKIILNNLLFILIEFIQAARWTEFFKRSSWSEHFTTKIKINIVILSIFIKIILYTFKKRARLSITFIIIILIFWRTDSWATSVNYLNMQLISISLLNIVLILRFSIIMFMIEQTTVYIRRKKTTRITISFKCIDLSS